MAPDTFWTLLVDSHSLSQPLFTFFPLQDLVVRGLIILVNPGLMLEYLIGTENLLKPTILDFWPVVKE